VNMVEAELLEKGDERAAAAALTASHAEYPAFRHVFAHPDRRARALLPFFTATVHDARSFDATFVSRDQSRALATVVSLPPGAFPWSALRKLRATPALARVFAADPRAFPVFSRYGANTERAFPIEPCWYVETLGVRPDAQRTGLGSALLARVLELSDRARVSCYLETSDPTNVAFYQRFGFRVVDAALALAPNGPKHVSMRRQPP